MTDSPTHVRGSHADNFHFDMTGVDLQSALAIAFCNDKKAIGWAELSTENEPVSHSASGTRLVLYAHEGSQKDINHFPGKLGHEQAIPLVKSWLDEVKFLQKAPDHDGDNSRGWRVYNEAWNRVAGDYGAFVAIEPVWLTHGK